MTIMGREDSRKREGKAGAPVDEEVQAALDRLFPVLTEGFPPAEAEKAGKTLAGLYALRAAEPGGPGRLAEEIGKRQRLAEGLSPEGRRRLLQEDELALAVKILGSQVFRDALGVMKGDLGATPGLKRETRHTVARLGQLNAILVGRFPHLEGPLREVSESYLDAMFILGGGKGPMSTRLAMVKREPEETGKVPPSTP